MITPEPAGDIRAQLRAVLDPEHPKRACFMLPEDFSLPPDTAGAFVEQRAEGNLVTYDKALALAFRHAPKEPGAEFDRAMAEILGYPEAKPDVMLACQGRLFTLARVVQARDAEDWVVQEAMTSPAMLGHTTEEVQKHVPPGGNLVILSPINVLHRRLLLREAGK